MAISPYIYMGGMLSSNISVERRAAALTQPKLLYLDSSTPSDDNEGDAACSLQRKLASVKSGNLPNIAPPVLNHRAPISVR
jgi:hypothetical protein